MTVARFPFRFFRPLLASLLGAGGLLAAAPAELPAKPVAAGTFPLQQQAVMAHLNAAVNWYHQIQAGSGWLLQPSDSFYWNTQRALADDALKSAFASAQAVDVLIARHAPRAATAAAAATDAREARLEARVATNSDQLAKLQQQLADLDKQLATATDATRPGLLAMRDVVQAQIDLDSALAQSLEKISTLLAGSTAPSDAASMAGEIAALQRSVPAVFDATAETAAKTQPPLANAGNSEGLINRASALFSLVRSRRAMDKLIIQTGELQAAARKLATPLTAAIREAVQRGEDASEQAQQLSDPTQMAAIREKIEQSAVELRELSAAVLPLRQEAMLLERSHNNLTEWRASFVSQTDTILRILFVHAGSVLAALVLLMVISEIWRRATFKYVRDPRRRRQFLLIRRFVTGTLLGIVVIVGFVSDFSSIATFAGFMTAGIAVALQTVVLSVAAYFFLIGRFGVKVGDRVTVSGVTGDVIDIGLVRVFLMELAGTGLDFHPTGRVVVLANSALFSAVPVFKQLPGTEYVWHEIAVGLTPDSDTAHVQSQLLAAVNAIYSTYRSSLEHQHNAVERLIDLRLDIAVPTAQIRFTDSGLEVVVRFPVELHRTAEIDGLVTKQVIEAIAADETLKKSLAGTPRLRSAVKG